MASSGFVLFRQGDSLEGDEDIWDDSALIKAYDKAVRQAKEKVAAKLGFSDEDGLIKEGDDQAPQTRVPTGQSKSSPKKSRRKQWSVGDFCQAVYSEDGELYEGDIVSVNESSQMCVVRFVGYENEEEVSLADLLPSAGAKARNQQKLDSQADVSEMTDNDTRLPTSVPPEPSLPRESTASGRTDTKPPHGFAPNSGFQHSLPMLPPPPPSVWPVPPQDPGDHSETLYSMLMAWYMAGYHTGLYQGQQMSRSDHTVQKGSGNSH